MTSNLATPALSNDSRDDFAVQLERVLTDIRLALSDALAAVGADPTRPQQMARDLKLNKNLTWKMASLLREPDAPTASTFLPGEEGIRIIASALRNAGAATNLVHAIESGATALSKLVDRHAGDRATFDLMVGAISQGDHRQQHLEASRKLAFRGNSAIFGVQARLQLALYFVAPSAQPNALDTAIAASLIDLARLRPDVSWSVASRRTYRDDGTDDQQSAHPLDPALQGSAEAPLLKRFCSAPLPELRVVPQSDGVTRFELPGGPIGRQATVSCATGWIFRGGASAVRTPTDAYGEFGTHLVTPCECMVHELFVHRSLPFAQVPEAMLFTQLPGGRVYPAAGNESVRLPLVEAVEPLPGDPVMGVLPEYTEYRTMLGEVFRMAGWSSTEFVGFRLRLRYPPIPTMLVTRFPLPE